MAEAVQMSFEGFVDVSDEMTYLSIRVVSWLEAKLGDAHLSEEDVHEADEVTQGDVVVRDNTFYLVEFSKMCCVDGFVSEDTVDGEELGGLELSGLLHGLCKLVEHVR